MHVTVRIVSMSTCIDVCCSFVSDTFVCGFVSYSVVEKGALKVSLSDPVSVASSCFAAESAAAE